MSAYGIWDLRNGAFHEHALKEKSVVDAAVSPTGRYLARIISNPRATGYTDSNLFQLHDLERGTVTTAGKALGVQSNSRSIEFLTDPLRVRIRNFAYVIISVPELVRLPERSADQLNAKPKERHPEARARLASRVCNVGGWLVPRAYCR